MSLADRLRTLDDRVIGRPVQHSDDRPLWMRALLPRPYLRTRRGKIEGAGLVVLAVFMILAIRWHLLVGLILIVVFVAATLIVLAGESRRQSAASRQDDSQ